ncbi:unnamed protein product [Heterobilharzia americana]|nr:unnamed protein product [Heterobilharzia americana]
MIRKISFSTKMSLVFLDKQLCCDLFIHAYEFFRTLFGIDTFAYANRWCWPTKKSLFSSSSSTPTSLAVSTPDRSLQTVNPLNLQSTLSSNTPPAANQPSDSASSKLFSIDAKSSSELACLPQPTHATILPSKLMILLT